MTTNTTTDDRVHLELSDPDGTTTTCVAGTTAEIAAVLETATALLDEIRPALDALDNGQED